MRIAIIGSGIAGLAAARRLCVEHRVTVFEASAVTGGHASTIEVEIEGKPVQLDTAFAAFTDRGSPGYASLLRELGVETRAVRGGLAVSDAATGERYDRWWASGAGPWLAGVLRPERRRVGREVASLGQQARIWRASGAPTEGTVADLVARLGLSKWTRERCVAPMVAATLGLGGRDVENLPLGVFARAVAPAFLEEEVGLQWRSVAGGTRACVRAMVAAIEERGGQVRTRSEVRWVRRSPGSHRYQANFASEGGVEVVSKAGVERFDAVVLATAGDEAMSLLADPSVREREVLGGFAYREGQAVVHTDARIVPGENPAAWNVRVGEGVGDGPGLTVDAGMLQGVTFAGGSRALVTHHDAGRVDPRTTLRLLRFRRLALTAGALASQKRHGEISGISRTFYAGSYWRDGLHEDGLWSGERAGEQVLRWARMTRG